MTHLEVLSAVFGTGLVLVIVGLCTCIKKAKSSVIGRNEDQIKNLEAGNQLSNQTKKPTSNRRLPEIPPSSISSPDENFNRTVRRDSGQDAYSDLYAQLGNAADPDRTPLKLPKIETLQSHASTAAEAGAATPPYAKIKKSNHPYSKIKKKAEREHPYASVRGADDPQEGDETDTDSYDVIETRRSVTEDVDFNLSGSGGPAPPPRGRRPVTSFELGSGPSSSNASHPRPLSYIPGVDYNPAGGSQMVDGRPGGDVDGPHFSGDSQDSKGYSCITVRESLALLRAKIAQENLPTRSSRPGALVTRQESMSDPNYATVSEAEYSENLYSAIPDPAGNIYSLSAGGSETYARVDVPPPPPALVASASAHDTSQDNLPPEPPSVMSLKHLSLASRHGSMASMLSATSSLNVSMSSPKPERRKANSPLPPPPSPHNGDMYATVNKARRNSRTLAEHGRTAVKSLEEMYAKVLKRKSASLSRASDASFLSQSESSSHRGSVDLGQLDFTEPKKGHRKTGSGPSGIGGRRGSADTLGSRQSLGCSLDHLRSFPSLPEEMNYEALKNNLLSDIGYEKLGEKLYPEGRAKDAGYERLKERVPDNDPGYEKVKSKDEAEREDNDPGYEKVKMKGTNAFVLIMDTKPLNNMV